MSNPHCAYRDALIDAETLMRNAPEVGSWARLASCNPSRAIYRAQHCFQSVASVKELGRALAHSAFRAIPALKEE